MQTSRIPRTNFEKTSLFFNGCFFFLEHLFFPGLEGGEPDDTWNNEFDEEGENDRAPVVAGGQEHQQW